MKKHYELRGLCLFVFGLAMLHLSSGNSLSYAERTCHDFINDQLNLICVNGLNKQPPNSPVPTHLVVEVMGPNGYYIKPHILKLCCYKKCSYQTYKQFCKPF